MLLGYMARNQYGTTIHLGNVKHPKAALLTRLGRRSAEKMYCDDKNGKAKHIGYITGGIRNGEWWTLYEVHEWVGGR